MENNPTTPTIAELWREFEKIKNHRYDAQKLDDPGFRKMAQDANGGFESLRAQLIERCKRVPDQDGDLTTLRLVCNRDRIATEPCGILHRVDNSKTAREMSAAYAFWAWELEQREKEAQP